MTSYGSQQLTPGNGTTQHAVSKPYKVVLENVTQEKKPLRIEDAYTETPPNGYAFVPIGHPEVTEYCKETCRQNGQVVYAVTTSARERHRRPNNISRQINRAGFHFPSGIVAKAHALHGTGVGQAGLLRTGRGLQYVDNGVGNLPHLARQLNNHGQRLRSHQNLNELQIQKGQIDATIKELFPRIPEGDVKAIVERAFKEGADTVGNADDMPLARKVQLAVGAHVRHTHTHYDQLLKVVDWETARKEIEKEVVAVLVRWRGEVATKESAIEFEEIFREVIVIDDDGDDDAGAVRRHDNRVIEREEDYEPPEDLAEPRRRRFEDFSPVQPAYTADNLNTRSRANFPQIPTSAVSPTRVAPGYRSPRGMMRGQDENWPQVEREGHYGYNLESFPMLPQQRDSGYVRIPPDTGTGPHRGWDGRVGTGIDRPMFISSARPDEPAVYESIEKPEVGRKRKSFASLKSPVALQETQATANKRNRMEEPRTPTHASRFAQARTRGRFGDEEIEVIDLRSPAALELSDRRQAFRQQGEGYAGERGQGMGPYTVESRAPPPRQRVYIDAYTGEPIGREQVDDW